MHVLIYKIKKKNLLHIIGGLSKLYNDKGRSVTFANLFDELAEIFPIDKKRRLQDLIESKRHIVYVFL